MLLLKPYPTVGLVWYEKLYTMGKMLFRTISIYDITIFHVGLKPIFIVDIEVVFTVSLPELHMHWVCAIVCITILFTVYLIWPDNHISLYDFKATQQVADLRSVLY